VVSGSWWFDVLIHLAAHDTGEGGLQDAASADTARIGDGREYRVPPEATLEATQRDPGRGRNARGCRCDVVYVMKGAGARIPGTAL